MTFRGFIAVDVPATAELRALVADLKRAGGDLKVVSAEQLHLTLKFLGDTEEGLVPEIVTTMREACADVAPFEIRVQGTGAFPSLHRMNVLWVGVEGAEPLVRIASALDAGLETLGFPRERRRWTAHVTVARAKGRRGLERAREVLAARVQDVLAIHRVDAVHLKKSILAAEGPRYSIVETVFLPA